jgi:hypothetical protein
MNRLSSLLILTVVFTGLNAVKPLHMDDAGFHHFAAQTAVDPWAPYGFEIIWTHLPRPAIEILAPPVLPYWWGLGIHLFGQQPLLWKLWLWPFSVLLVFSLHALLQRLVCKQVMALLWMTVLSPAILPGFNLMSDLPALSVSLCAITVFLRAADHGSMGWAFLAGLLAGLAMQTKYTAFTVPIIFVLYAVLFRCIPLGLLASGTAMGVFVVWEALMLHIHGASHFLCTCAYFQVLQRSPWSRVGHLLLALPTLTGGLAPAVMLLGLAALGRSRLVLQRAGAAVLVAYLSLLLVPEPWSTLLRYAGTNKPALTLNNVVYGGLGAGFCLVLGAVVSRLLRKPTPDQSQPALPKPTEGPFSEAMSESGFLQRGRRVEWFLALWLAVELGGYFALSPFPAARRILALIVVATLLAGRLSGRRSQTFSQRALPSWVVGGSILLGLSFYAIDWRDAWAQKQAAEEAAQFASVCEGGGTVWFIGIWGFEFYAERAGLQPLVLGRSDVHKGDRIVVYDDYFLFQHPFVDDEAPLEVISQVRIEDAFPLRTVVGYYSGATPLHRQLGPRASATVYHATANFIPQARPGFGG